MSSLPSPLLALQSGGMVTAIGNSTEQTAASWLTRVRRQRRIHLEGFADPFTIADCSTVTEGMSDMTRLNVMLTSAMAEALDKRGYQNHELPERADKQDKRATAGTTAERLEILVLPEWMNEQSCEYMSDKVSACLQAYPQWSDAKRERLIVQTGHSGAWEGLEHAYRALEKNPFLTEIMLMAADSACGSAQLQIAAGAGLLLQPGNSQGYVPGESAVCLLLKKVSAITAVEADGFALHRPALVQADGPFWPAESTADAGPLVQVLAQAMQNAGMQAEHISHLLSDMDGSDWRARMESVALNRTVFMQTNELPHWRPANLLGQSGAASGMVGWLLPAFLHKRGAGHINTVLNWTITPRGEAAACVLERSPY